MKNGAFDEDASAASQCPEEHQDHLNFVISVLFLSAKKRVYGQ